METLPPHPNASLLAKMLREHITPVVMVLPTAAVEEACRKNKNMAFLDLLRPFCTSHHIDVPVRTTGDQPYRLQEFRLRLFYASALTQPKSETAEEYLLQLVSDASDDAFAELQGDPKNIEVIRKMAQSESLSSWFQRYSKEFIRLLAFSDHESIDHPVACLLVVSSRDENPVNQFVDLFNTDKLPALLNDGAMDPRLLKYYLLLHDNQDGSLDRANKIYSEMTATFGPTSCRLLCINSSTHQLDDVAQEIWTSQVVPSRDLVTIEDNNEHANTSLQEQKLSWLLNAGDFNEISDFMLDLSAKQIIPYMEQKVRALNQQVAATKRGLRNQIKNLWWRKGKDDATDVTNGPTYTFSSTESQIRLLADYAFMLCDYELALSNYRLLSSDYRTDKAWKHYAGVQEMIAMSLFMLDHSRKEAEYCMETAFSSYQKVGLPGQRFATRCALWWTQMHKARGQYKEAASVYSRAAAEESSLCAAILLEQAAYCYLCAIPPLLRKYGFHLVLSGTRYNACGQKKHAIRVFMAVLTVYEAQGWSYISDHVHFHLGRLSTFLGKFSDAVTYFMRLLACSDEPPSMQATFLKEFLNIVQNEDIKQESLRLDLPIIDMDSLHVQFEDQHTYMSAAAAALPEDMWLPLEAGLVPLTPSTSTNWLDVGLRNQPTLTCRENFKTCVAGEDLIVSFEFKNPLKIAVNVSGVSLLCKFVPDCDEKLGLNKSYLSVEDIEENDVASLMADAGTDWGRLSEEAFSLKAGEKVVAKLKVTPYNQGILFIIGVKWVLSGVVKGYRVFTIQCPKRKLRGGTKSHEKVNPHKCLRFYVLKHMPRLEVSLHGMPVRVNAGELHRLVLELSNVSATPIRRIKFNTSHFGVLLVGTPADLDAEFPGCLEARTDDDMVLEFDAESNSSGTKDSIYIFSKDIVVEGGSTLLWPLWLHAREEGILQLNNVLYYEVDKTLADLQYRTVRMAHSLQVIPSLQIAIHISRCLQHLNRYLLRLDIRNRHTTESFWLRQVSCAGKKWLIAPLLPPVADTDSVVGSAEDVKTSTNAAFLSASVSPSQLLPAEQTTSLFFQLLDCEDGKSHVENLRRTSISEFSCNVRLGPPSSNEPIIDIVSTPISKFHMRERIIQKQPFLSMHNKVGAVQGMLDILLVSEQQDEASADKQAALRDNQRLATHHLCHCSVQDSIPLVWLMEGPKTVVHDFTSDPFCEISLMLTIKNCSHHVASVVVETTPSMFLSSPTPSVSMPAQSTIGWYDLSESNSGTAASDSIEKQKSLSEDGKAEFIAPCGSLVWCSVTCNQIKELKAGAMERLLFRIAVFAPGVYDLSSGYSVKWKLSHDQNDLCMFKRKIESAQFNIQLSNEKLEIDDDNEETYSGFGSGNPFLLTVCQMGCSDII